MLPWTPSLLDLDLWFAGGSAANYTLSGQDILQWTDLSGNERHLTPATALRPKRLYSGTFFDTGADALITPEYANQTGTDGVSFFMTVDAWEAVPVSYSNLITKGPVNEQWSVVLESQALGNRAIIRTQSADSATTATALGTGGKIIAGSIYNTGLALAVDGVLRASAGALARTFGAASRLTLGSSPSNAYSDNRFYGWIGDLIVTKTVLSNDDFQRVIGYLAWQRGMQSSLQPEHPYASAAPLAYGYTGYVFDASGQTADRTVRCYRDSDGELISQTVSNLNGYYTLPVRANVSHTLVASGEPNRNSLVLGGVLPG